MKDLLLILGILVLCFELYRLLWGNWIRRIFKKKKVGKGSRKPQVMKPKSEQDCPFCVSKKIHLDNLLNNKDEQIADGESPEFSPKGDQVVFQRNQDLILLDLKMRQWNGLCTPGKLKILNISYGFTGRTGAPMER
jgi:hypothetical protein